MKRILSGNIKNHPAGHVVFRKKGIIYIDNFSRDEYITILSHELIHLKQYYNGELKINSTDVIWKGDIIDLTLYTYENRPWEREAFDNENKIYFEMKKILYK